MSAFFLTEEQEYLVNEFLDRENRKICQEQLNSEDIPEELKVIIQKTMEAGSPMPAFDPQVGYYSISFTPCDSGNRIYIHHHMTNVSEAIDDPLHINVEDPSDLVTAEIVPNEQEISIGPEMTMEQIEQSFGKPPEEIQQLINQ